MRDSSLKSSGLNVIEASQRRGVAYTLVGKHETRGNICRVRMDLFVNAPLRSVRSGCQSCYTKIELSVRQDTWAPSPPHVESGMFQSMDIFGSYQHRRAMAHERSRCTAEMVVLKLLLSRAIAQVLMLPTASSRSPSKQPSASCQASTMRSPDHPRKQPHRPNLQEHQSLHPPRSPHDQPW